MFLRDSFVLIPLSLVLCRATETAAVIEELIAMAKEMREPGVSRAAKILRSPDAIFSTQKR
jgi:hypothetical protein